MHVDISMYICMPGHAHPKKHINHYNIIHAPWLVERHVVAEDAVGVEDAGAVAQAVVEVHAQHAQPPREGRVHLWHLFFCGGGGEVGGLVNYQRSFGKACIYACPFPSPPLPSPRSNAPCSRT